MTTSDHKKMLKQLEVKQAKKKKFLKHNEPKKRTTGESLKKCKMCGRTGGHIRRYGLGMCRQCFRLNAKKLGFKKYM